MKSCDIRIYFTVYTHINETQTAQTPRVNLASRVDFYRLRLIIRQSTNASFALCVQYSKRQENGQAIKAQLFFTEFNNARVN